MTRDFDHDTGFIQPCPDCELLEAYRDQWKKTSVRLIDQNYNLEKDRDYWRNLCVRLSDSVTNEGRNPSYHRKIIIYVRNHWATHWAAVSDIVKAVEND